ncbi:MAG: hypothetical protein DMG39_05860 [Acidobacteria bacterium]|nr:MAG: hypothetical protein DMG39_05860 [Acidobacteriota bacterium]
MTREAGIFIFEHEDEKNARLRAPESLPYWRQADSFGLQVSQRPSNEQTKAIPKRRIGASN